MHEFMAILSVESITTFISYTHVDNNPRHEFSKESYIFTVRYSSKLPVSTPPPHLLTYCRSGALCQRRLVPFQSQTQGHTRARRFRYPRRLSPTAPVPSRDRGNDLRLPHTRHCGSQSLCRDLFHLVQRRDSTPPPHLDTPPVVHRDLA